MVYLYHGVGGVGGRVIGLQGNRAVHHIREGLTGPSMSEEMIGQADGTEKVTLSHIFYI